MALEMIRDSMEVEQLVGEGLSQTLVEGEVLVPGAGRDLVEPLLADAQLSVGSVEVQQDRVALDGTVNCQVLYRVGDDPQVRTLTTSIAMSHVADIPGAGPRMSSQVMGDIEHMEAVYESGRMMLRAVATLRIRVLSLTPVALIRGFEGVPGIEVRTESVTSLKTSADARLSVFRRESFDLPPVLAAREMLMCRGVPTVLSVTPDMGGVNVRGKVALEALVASDVPGRPVNTIRHTVPFEQLIEMPDWLSGDVRATVTVRSLNSTLMASETGSQMHCEIELDLGAQALQQDTTNAVADAYVTSGQAGVEVTQETLNLLAQVMESRHEETVKISIQLPEGAPGVGAVLTTLARPVVSDWTLSAGGTQLDGVMDVTVVYLPTGSDVPAAIQEEVPFTMMLEGEIQPGAWLRLESLEADALPVTADRLELKALVQATVNMRKTTRKTVALSAQETEPVPQKKGILLVYTRQGDSLWDLGKRYALPMDEIGAMNPEAATGTMGARPMIIYRK